MTIQEKQIYYRIVALWAISEAILGGIIHGLKLPISGLIVGSFAVICISLIGHLLPQKGLIIKATIIVALIKMTMSPQSPFMAYVAVMFQGIMGELIFRGKKYYQLRCYIFSLIALLESAFQRIIIMTIIFGMNFWEAVNDFITKLTGGEIGTNYSFYFVSLYISIHVFAAILIGRFTSRLPNLLSKTDDHLPLFQLEKSAPDENATVKPVKKRLNFIFVIWILLTGIFIHAAIFPEKALLPTGETLNFIFRSSFLLLTWYFLFAPLLIRLLKRFLENKKGQLKVELEEIMLLLPTTKKLIILSWQLSRTKKGWARLTFFGHCVIVNALRIEEISQENLSNAKK